MKPQYGLFEKVDGKWVRLYPQLQYSLALARRIFQSALLAYAMGHVPHVREIRKVRF